MPPNDEFFDGYYYIECKTCLAQENFPRNTTKLHVFIDGLGSYTEYSLIISCRNNRTILTGKYNHYNFKFKTKPGGKNFM